MRYIQKVYLRPGDKATIVYCDRAGLVPDGHIIASYYDYLTGLALPIDIYNIFKDEETWKFTFQYKIDAVMKNVIWNDGIGYLAFTELKDHHTVIFRDDQVFFEDTNTFVDRTISVSPLFSIARGCD